MTGESGMPVIIQADINALDYTNKYFISPPAADELVKSIEKNGILVRPSAVKKEGKYNVVCGHNRVRAARQAGIKNIVIEVLPEEKAGLYQYRDCLRKEQERTLAPVSLLLLVDRLQSSQFSEENALAAQIRIPYNLKDSKDFLLADNTFIEYALRRRASFKIVRAYMRLPDKGIAILQKILSIDPKINVFKECIQLVDEIIRKGENIDLEVTDETKESDIISALNSIRYPLYSELKKKADAFQAQKKTRDISIQFPDYFEGGYADIQIRINAEDSPPEIQDKIQNLQQFDYSSLIELLKDFGGSK